MQNFQNRSFKRKIMYSWPVVAAVFLVAAFLGQAAARSYFAARNTRLTYEEAKKDREEVGAQRTELEKRLDYLSSPYGLERELRRKFGLAKPGESLMIIVDRPKETVFEEKNNFSSFVAGVGDFFGRIFGIEQ